MWRTVHTHGGGYLSNQTHKGRGRGYAHGTTEREGLGVHTVGKEVVSHFWSVRLSTFYTSHEVSGWSPRTYVWATSTTTSCTRWPSARTRHPHGPGDYYSCRDSRSTSRPGRSGRSGPGVGDDDRPGRRDPSSSPLRQNQTEGVVGKKSKGDKTNNQTAIPTSNDVERPKA